MNAHERTVTIQKARLFRNGRSQAVRIPKKFEFEGSEVLISRDDKGKLTLEPVIKALTLLEVLATMKPLAPADRFPEIDDGDLLPLDEVEW